MLDAMQSAMSMTALAATLAVAAWSDWRRWRVSNGLLGCSALVALGLSLIAPAGSDFGTCLLGGLTGLALFMPHYLMRGMAAGDVKLLGVVGMYTGPVLTFQIALASALVGGIWALVVLLKRRRDALSLPSSDRKAAGSSHRKMLALQHLTDEPLSTDGAARLQAIPYGVVMAIGTAIVLLIVRP